MNRRGFLSSVICGALWFAGIRPAWPDIRYSKEYQELKIKLFVDLLKKIDGMVLYGEHGRRT